MVEYNFYNLFKGIDNLHNHVREDEDSVRVEAFCQEIKKELNKFFPSFECAEILYTVNTDKQFFGIQVRPVGGTSANPAKFIGEVLKPEFESFAYPRYQVEFDSRLFTETTLDAAEIGTLLLHDINAISGTNAITLLRDAIDALRVFSDRPINQALVLKTGHLFVSVSEITIRNLTSIFAMSYNQLQNNEAEMPDFISGYNLSSYYSSAVKKLMALCTIKTDCEYPTLLLTWYFNIYHTSTNSKYMLNMLKKAIKYEGSTLVKRSIKLSLSDFAEINPAELRNIEAVTESRKGLIFQMKRNGIRSLEDDLYEYTMRLRNVETQDEAILLMRQINGRMTILEDYLREEDLDEKDRKRWEQCYEKYMDIRNQLSKKTVYNRKMYGLFVDYNALQNMSQSGQLMNTYY